MCALCSTNAATATTPEQHSQGRRPQTPQPPHPRPESRADSRRHHGDREDRDLLDRAAAALGTDRSSFLLSQGRLAAQKVLADREHFVLDAAAQQEWERINSGPVRVLPGLKRLLERPSPFVPKA